MATATKHSPTTPSASSSSASVPGSPQSPNNNNNNHNNFHQLHHHHNLGSTTTLTSPGHIASYEYSQRQSSSTRQSYVDGNQEEISSIAKQISDHAEAIYQTWKARGLAPTEILSCQLSTTAEQQAQLLQQQHKQQQLSPASLDPVTRSSANPFQQRRLASPPPLSYAPLQTMPLSTANSHSPSGGVGGGGNNAGTALNELLAQPPDMSNNNKLEKLVNSFVNEDKARIAAQRRSSSQLSSSSSGVESPSSPIQQQPSSLGSSPTKKKSSNNHSSLPSLSSVSVIKQQLQKFENNNNNNSPSAKNFNLIKPKGVGGPLSPVGSKFAGNGGPLSPPVNGREDRNNNSNNEEEEVSLGLQQRQQLLKKNLLNSSTSSDKKNVPDVLLDTISNNGSVHNNNNNHSHQYKSPAKPQTPVKPPNLLNHVPSWPLKSRSGSPVISNGSGSANGGGGVVLVHEIHIDRDCPDAAATIVPKLRSDSGGGGGSGSSVGVGGSKLSPGIGFLQNKMKSKSKGVGNNSSSSDEVTSIEMSSSEVTTAKRKGGMVQSASTATSASTSTPAPAAPALNAGLKKVSPQLLEDAVKREEECLINALKIGGPVLKSSGLVSDSMSKMTTTSGGAGGVEKKKGQEVGLVEPSSNNNDMNKVSSGVSSNSDNNGEQNKNGVDEDAGGVNNEDYNEQETDSDTPSGVNFELSTDVAGPPPSNLAHHVPKVWQNEDGVFEALTAASKPAVTSKMFKTRPVRQTSVLETMIHNEIFDAKVAKAKRDKELGLNPCTPFLSRGSVAERVLIFERCPEIKAPPRMPQKLEPNKFVSEIVVNWSIERVQVMS